MNTASAQGHIRPVPRSTYLTALTGGVAGALLNVAVLGVGNALVDGTIRTASPGGDSYADLGAATVAGATLLAAVLGALVWIALRRLVPDRARSLFLGLIGFATLASFASPLGLDIPGSHQFVLSVMHVVAAASIAVALVRFDR
jgi:Family of unknown function (DUF6069)